MGRDENGIHQNLIVSPQVPSACYLPSRMSNSESIPTQQSYMGIYGYFLCI